MRDGAGAGRHRFHHLGFVTLDLTAGRPRAAAPANGAFFSRGCAANRHQILRSMHEKAGTPARNPTFLSAFDPNPMLARPSTKVRC